MSSAARPADPGVTVLVAAAGAAWEAEALDRLARRPGIVVGRRCVDLPDLLATAGTASSGVAVVSPLLPGLDADSVAGLRRAGLALVLVAAPDDLADGDAERLRRLGAEHLLLDSELGGLPETVLGAGTTGTSSVAAGATLLGSLLVEPTGTTPPSGPASGRMVAVWGPTGAPGRTTVAVGLSAALAQAGHDVLLVDADAYGGAVAQHLGVLDEVSGLLAALRAANSGTLDAERLAALARTVAERWRVLTGLPRPDRWREVRPVAFADLLEQAARSAAWTVLDLGFCLEAEAPDPYVSTAPQRNHMTLAALERAEEVIVVGAADPVSLARLARGLVELKEVLPEVRPRVVVNRTRASLGWTDREILGMVEGFVSPRGVHFLPEDRAAADRALMAGRSLAESGESALRTRLAALAADLAGAAVPVRRGARLRRRRAQAPNSR